MPCSPLDPLSYGSCAGSIARSAAGDAFSGIARSFGQAAQSATNWLWAQINAATAVSLGGAGFHTVLLIVATIAGVVAVALFVVQVLQSILRRDPGGLGRAVRGLLVAFLAGGAAVTVVDLLLAAVDSLCAGVVQTTVGTDPAGLGRLVLGPNATAALARTGTAGSAATLLMSLAVIVAVVIVYAALVIRKVLIVLTAAFAPLAFAGSLADITVAWTRRWIELTVALIFSKLALVLIFLIGYYMLVQGAGQAGGGATQELTQVASGALVLALAGFAPWLALKVVHFTGDHASQLHSLGATTTAGAATAGRLGQKAVAVTATPAAAANGFGERGIRPAAPGPRSPNPGGGSARPRPSSGSPSTDPRPSGDGAVPPTASPPTKSDPGGTDSSGTSRTAPRFRPAERPQTSSGPPTPDEGDDSAQPPRPTTTPSRPSATRRQPPDSSATVAPVSAVPTDQPRSRP